MCGLCHDMNKQCERGQCNARSKCGVARALYSQAHCTHLRVIGGKLVAAYRT